MSSTASDRSLKSLCRHWLSRLKYRWAKRTGALQDHSPYYEAEMQSLQTDLQSDDGDLNQILSQYHNAFDHAPMSYLFVDRHGYIIRVNKMASQLLNISNRFAKHHPRLIDFVSSESRDSFINVFEQALANPEEIKSQQIQLKITRNLRANKINSVISITLKTKGIKPGEGDYRFLVTLFPLTEDSWPVYQAS
ncbi:MAG: PAS domain-containing protein [Methylophaga sp.]|nr:PAS domain-containing protein [Methylophaga sp.]